MTTMTTAAEDDGRDWAGVLDFWFAELGPEDWFAVNAELDAGIRRRFGALHRRGTRVELWRWRETVPGRLAEIIVLDQFSRNICRGDAAAFAADPLALALTQEALAAGADRELVGPRRNFLYMPLMHSESLVNQRRSVELFDAMGAAQSLDFAVQHLRIIERFGRFPHRNAILGRASTVEEIEFLKTPGSSF